MNTSISKKITFYILLISLFAILLSAIVIVQNNKKNNALKIEQELAHKEKVLIGIMHDSVNEAKKKLLAIESFPPIKHLIHEASGKELEDMDIWKQRLIEIFQSFLVSFPNYSQLRLVKYEGSYQEIVRVNRLADNSIVVANEVDSHPEALRYYLDESKNLTSGSYYVSDIDLNKDGDEISIPYVLTMRVVKPIFINNQKLAYLIINIDVKETLSNLKNSINIESNFDLRDSLDRVLFTTSGTERIPFDGLKWRNFNGENERAWKMFSFNNNSKYYFSINSSTKLTSSTEHIFEQLLPSVIIIFLICTVLFYFMNSLVLKPVENMASYVVGIESALNIVDPQSQIGAKNLSMNEIENLNTTLRRLVTRLLSQNHKIEEQGRFLNSVALYYRANKLGNLLFVNPNFMSITGYQREELIGKNMKLLNSGRHEKKFWKNFWNTISVGEEWKGQIWNKNKYGDVFVLDSTVMPIKNEFGDVVEFVGVSFDITDEVKTKEKLKIAKQNAEKAEKSKSAFLANMSHEIRTPMNGIIGMIDMLKNTIKEPTYLKQLDILESSGNSLLEIINNILDFSKIEAGAIKVNHKDFNLQELTNNKIDLLKTLADKKSIALTVDIDDDVPLTINSDPQLIGQILNNLVSNALKFTNQGQVKVKISLKSEKDKIAKIEMAVIDTGIGIPSSKANQLFKEFQQIDNDSTRNYQGTGLGLAISLNLAKVLGGNITFESVEGEGTTFYFSVPVKVLDKANAVNYELKEATQVTPMQTGRLNVLIVDDNEINQFVTKSFIEKLDCNVSLASSGSQALELLGQTDYDVIFMDCHMPGMDGHETTQKIISTFGASRPKIIGFSASVMQEDIEKCYASGMDAFLGKPIKLNDVNKVLAELNVRH